jgi:hypothetical protein
MGGGTLASLGLMARRATGTGRKAKGLGLWMDGVSALSVCRAFLGDEGGIWVIQSAPCLCVCVCIIHPFYERTKQGPPRRLWRFRRLPSPTSSEVSLPLFMHCIGSGIECHAGYRHAISRVCWKEWTGPSPFLPTRSFNPSRQSVNRPIISNQSSLNPPINNQPTININPILQHVLSRHHKPQTQFINPPTNQPTKSIQSAKMNGTITNRKRLAEAPWGGRGAAFGAAQGAGRRPVSPCYCHMYVCIHVYTHTYTYTHIYIHV